MLNISGTFSSFREFADALGKADKVMHKHMSRAYFSVGNNYIQFHRAARLTGRPGLNSVSRIGINRSAHTEIGGNSLSNLTGITFFQGLVTKYVKVHEFGATIVPVKAKLLKFQVEGQWRTAKSVTIKPRLKWFSGWEQYARHREETLDNAASAALVEIAQ